MSAAPETTLWRAVLTTAIKDVIVLKEDSVAAVHWLTCASDEHVAWRTRVFEYAGFEEANVEHIKAFVHRFILLVLDGKRPIYKAKKHLMTVRKPTDSELEIANDVSKYLDKTGEAAPLHATTEWLADCFKYWNKRDDVAQIDRTLLS